MLFYWVQLNISTYQVPGFISDNLPPGFCENWELVWMYISILEAVENMVIRSVKIRIQFCLLSVKLVWTLMPCKTTICQSPQPVLRFLINRNIVFCFSCKFCFLLWVCSMKLSLSSTILNNCVMPSIMQYMCYVFSQPCTEIKGRTSRFAKEQFWPVNSLGRQGQPADNLHTAESDPALCHAKGKPV